MQISELKGLGTKSTEALASIGIHSIDQLMKADPYSLYASLKNNTPNTSLNMLYAIIGAQENIHWQTIAQTRKTEILMRLDDLGIAP